ncbi:MAG: hypothetical protein PHI66_05040 [Candidatus Pacebacteria bacterium]|nr:hypothetical protein [Candidatus Paceibacterota bacterium]
MQQIEIVSKFMKNIVWGLATEGILAIVVGILVFIYPDLLGMLVGTLVIIGGIVSVLIAVKINKYSKIKVDL